MVHAARCQETEIIVKVEELHEFETLKGRWGECLARSLDNSIFLTWEWLSTWWEHFKRGKELIILLVEDGGEILSIASFVCSEHNFHGFGHFKKISLAGSPESDYNSFVLCKNDSRLVQLSLDYLCENFDWDYLELSDISESSVSLELLCSESLKERFDHWKVRKGDLCPYVLLPSSMELFMRGLGKNMRRGLGKDSRRLEREHRVELKSYTDVGSVDDAMQMFFQLHRKRWESKGLSGVLHEKPLRDFHVDIAKSFAHEGWLRLSFLTLDSQPVAAKYAFEYNQKVYNYLGGWDPDYSEYGISNLLKMYDIRDCIQKGVKEFDLMRGDEEYKRRWTREARRNFVVRFVRKGRFLKLHDRIVRTDKIN